MDRRGFLGGLVHGTLALLGLSVVEQPEGLPNGLPSSLRFFPVELIQFKGQTARGWEIIPDGDFKRVWVEAHGPPPGLDVHAFRQALVKPRNAVINGKLYHVFPTKLEMTPFAGLVRWEAELRKHA